MQIEIQCITCCIDCLKNGWNDISENKNRLSMDGWMKRKISINNLLWIIVKEIFPYDCKHITQKGKKQIILLLTGNTPTYRT